MSSRAYVTYRYQDYLVVGDSMAYIYAIILLFAVYFVEAVSSSKQPHLFMILSDDFGWADIGACVWTVPVA